MIKKDLKQTKVVEYIKGLKSKNKKQEILNVVMKEMFCAILEIDIMPWKKLSDEDKNLLISEAKAVNEMELFKRLMKEMRLRARMQMNEKALTYDDMFFGKAVLYVTDIIEKRIKKIGSL